LSIFWPCALSRSNWNSVKGCSSGHLLNPICFSTHRQRNQQTSPPLQVQLQKGIERVFNAKLEFLFLGNKLYQLYCTVLGMLIDSLNCAALSACFSLRFIYEIVLYSRPVFFLCQIGTAWLEGIRNIWWDLSLYDRSQRVLVLPDQIPMCQSNWSKESPRALIPSTF